MQKAIQKSFSHTEDANNHTGLWNSGSDGNEGLETWLGHLVSSSQKTAGSCGWDPEFRLQSPRFPVWHQSLSQATQTLFAGPYDGRVTSPLLLGEPGIKMHYRIQLPLFSPCLIKLHPTKLQLKKKNQKKELMVLIPSLSSCCFKMMLFTVQKSTCPWVHRPMQ